MCRLFVVAALLVGIDSILPAQEPVPNKSITQLIDQLSNDDFKVREAAAKSIEALGPEALPELRKAKDHPDLEVRRRIKAWIPRFETEAFVAPKRVSLDRNKEPVEKVVAELARQTGYKLELSSRDARAQKPIRVPFVKTTFWEAIDKVCQEGGLELSRERGNPETIVLGFDDARSPYRSYHGAFRIRADGFHYLHQSSLSKGIDFAPLPRNAALREEAKEEKMVSENFDFRFDLVAEPRLTVLYLGEPSLTQALDDQKRSLIPKKESDDERFGGHAAFMRSHRMRHRFFMGHEMDGTVNLLAPAKGARFVQVLRGTVPVYLLKETKRTVLVDNIAKAQGKKHKSEEFTVEIDLFKPVAGNRYHVFFSYTKDKSDEKNFDLGDDGSFELEDAKGNRYEAYGSGMHGDGRTIEAHVSFAPSMNNAGVLGPPVRLTYAKNIPMEYLVPFEFRDLPLP